MSDLSFKEQEKQKKDVERLSYEKKIQDVDELHDNYNSEKLLYAESTKNELISGSDIEALANYSEIKAKQRSAAPEEANIIHTIEYQRGKSAIGLLRTKNSHRSMRKRNNKMAESSKRLGNVSKDARKLKDEVEGMPLKKRLKSLEGLYDRVRVADRYLAEAVAGSQTEENKLKDKAEMNYLQNLCNMYSRESQKSNDPSEKETLTNKTTELYEKLLRLKEAYDRKYANENVTRHTLEEGEALSLDYNRSKEQVQRIREEAEESLKDFENKYKDNKVDKANYPLWYEKNKNHVNNFIYAKSKYFDSKDKDSLWLVTYTENEMKGLVSSDRKEAYYYNSYLEEKNRIERTYNKLSPEEREKILKSTNSFRNYNAYVCATSTSKVSHKIVSEENLTKLRINYEKKNNLLNPKDEAGFVGLRNIESLERKLEIYSNHLNILSENVYDDINFPASKTYTLEKIERTKKDLDSERAALTNAYIKDTGLTEINNITLDDIVSYYKNNIKLKDQNTGETKSLKEYDLNEEAKKRAEITERTGS